MVHLLLLVYRLRREEFLSVLGYNIGQVHAHRPALLVKILIVHLQLSDLLLDVLDVVCVHLLNRSRF